MLLHFQLPSSCIRKGMKKFWKNEAARFQKVFLLPLVLSIIWRLWTRGIWIWWRGRRNGDVGTSWIEGQWNWMGDMECKFIFLTFSLMCVYGMRWWWVVMSLLTESWVEWWLLDLEYVLIYQFIFINRSTWTICK